MMNEKQQVNKYTDLIMMAYDCVRDVSDDNKCGFDMNLDLFLEGLKEDIHELEAGREVRHLPIRPKTTQDIE